MFGLHYCRGAIWRKGLPAKRADVLDVFLAKIRGEERFKRLMELVKCRLEHFEE